jgi:hypothetical protein
VGMVAHATAARGIAPAGISASVGRSEFLNDGVSHTRGNFGDARCERQIVIVR